MSHADFGICYAHSVDRQPKSDWQTMAEHAANVAVMAGEHAEKFAARSLGEVAGLLHDLGKYSDEFQRKLRGAKSGSITRLPARE